jgi:HlyD family secretion protein
MGYGAIAWGLPARRSSDVITAQAARGVLIITVTERGELESAQSEQVLCEVEGGGKLATIIPEGIRVAKGDEVARLDTDALQKAITEQEVKWQTAVGKLKAAESELEVQRNKAESEIAKAKLDLDLAKIDVEAYEDKEGKYTVELEKRKAAIELAEKDLKDAEKELNFTRELVKKGFGQLEQLPPLERDVAAKKFTLQEKQADLNVFERFDSRRQRTELRAKAEDAERNLERTKKSQAAATEKAENELRAAEKTAELEEKHLARLREQMDKCIIKAPQDGILIYSKQRWWDDSSRIRPGANLYYQQQIFTLPDLDNMQVKLKVHESVVKKVRPGMNATLQIDALPGAVLHGKVKSVATLAQSDDWGRGGVKEYETVVTIDDLPTEAGLRPGMTAEVKILVKTIPDALTVPVSAVTESGGKHVCYVVTPSGVERREVKVGEGNEQLVQVLEGLAEGEQVVLDARVRAAAELKAAGGTSVENQQSKDETPPADDPPPPGGQ